MRASRGNFALVWVQSKGLGLPAYAGWTIRSSDAWGELRRKPEGGDRPRRLLRAAGRLPSRAVGGASSRARASMLKRLHNQPGIADYKTEILDRAQVGGHACPASAPRSSAAATARSTATCNSLRLFRALHTALSSARRALSAEPSRRAHRRTSGGEFRLRTPQRRDPRRQGRARRRQRQHAAGADGRASTRRCSPSAARSSSPSALQPFLHHPVVTIRQTDEGTRDDRRQPGRERRLRRTDDGRSMPPSWPTRAVRMFPLLASLNVVRTWSGIRVMTPGRLPDLRPVGDAVPAPSSSAAIPA